LTRRRTIRLGVSCVALFGVGLFWMSLNRSWAGDEDQKPEAKPKGSLEELRNVAELMPVQWNEINQGQPVARLLSHTDKLEIGVLGVARVRAGAACYAKQFQDIEIFKKNPKVLRIGKITLPLKRIELSGFRFEPDDLADLRNCRVGDCSLKLPASTIMRLQKEVDWSAPDYPARAMKIIRDDLWDYLEDYLTEGDDALMVYHDKSEPVFMATQFRALLDARPGLGELAPEFRDYLAQYPKMPLAGVTQFFYWSVEEFGLKPVASITHVIIYRRPGEAIIASKQIYADHYFDASLGLTDAVDLTSEPEPEAVTDAPAVLAAAPPSPAMYLMYLNRSQIDLLGGVFGGLRRSLARGRLRDGVKENLSEVVRKVESECMGDSAPVP
jgi:hypothetical protein